MQQGFLFEPERMTRAEVRLAIERLDFVGASLKLQELQRLWPSSGLTWEPELIHMGLTLDHHALDLDSGYDVWQKLESRLASLGASRCETAAIRRNFFTRLLAANRCLPEDLKTAQGRPLGDFYLLSEQPETARRRYEKLIRHVGDGWEPRLRLGNCDFRLGHVRVAHSNYQWSYLLGLPEESWNEIEDREFVSFLQEAENPGWAFAQLCAGGVVPPVRFSTSAEFEQFKVRFAAALIGAPQPRLFCLHWIISENRRFCSDGELLQARRQMKALNPELHARYLQRLD